MPGCIEERSNSWSSGKGFADLHNEWIPKENCTNAREEIDDFYTRFPHKPKSNDQVRSEIPLTMELRSLMCPLPTPCPEAIDDNLPSELQLNQVAYKSHRGRCDPKRGVMSRLHSPWSFHFSETDYACPTLRHVTWSCAPVKAVHHEAEAWPVPFEFRSRLCNHSIMFHEVLSGSIFHGHCCTFPRSNSI